MVKKRKTSSRKKMQDTLLELLRSKPYSKITITEINREAELSRRTFYEHFETKDDLLISLLDNVLEPIFSALTQDTLAFFQGKDDASAIVLLFNQWKENYKVLSLVRNTNCDLLMLSRFTDWFRKIYQEAVVPEFKTEDELIAEYTLNLIAGAYFRVITSWMDSGMIHSPEFMGNYLYSLLGHANVKESYTAVLDQADNFS